MCNKFSFRAYDPYYTVLRAILSNHENVLFR